MPTSGVADRDAVGEQLTAKERVHELGRPDDVGDVLTFVQRVHGRETPRPSRACIEVIDAAALVQDEVEALDDLATAGTSGHDGVTPVEAPEASGSAVAGPSLLDGQWPERGDAVREQRPRRSSFTNSGAPRM